jgi:hypothetical protein
MARRLPDGTELRWRLTAPGPGPVEVVPFLIEWAEGTPHPSATSAQGCRLVSFTAADETPGDVARRLAVLGFDLAVTDGPAPRLAAVIGGPGGTVELH